MEIKVMLESMVGQEASVNQSPTLNARLVEVYKSNTGNTVCCWEVTPNRYGDKGNEHVGEQFFLPLHISENCFWGV
jgi:hypothetical protein